MTDNDHAPDMVAFDLETLGTQQTSCILSIGVTTFNLNVQDDFDTLVSRGTNIILELGPQKKQGLTTDPDTLEWWKEQSEFSMRVFREAEPVHPLNLIKQLEVNLGLKYSQFCHMPWWARGSHFDGGILLNMCQMFDMPELWYYQNCRDVRTFMMFFPDFERGEAPESCIMHNSLHDAALDAMNMQQAWAQFILGK